MADYDHKAIEKKWQDKWAHDGIYRADSTSKKPKQYILDMFPYPSGSGLHVGHVEGYTATDIYSRFMRMQGHEVLHPMGWDAFGLPAENYAIKTGTSPQESTDQAIANFTKQIKSLGLSYDWDRELGTHSPEYYRFTQWFFLFMYKNGLAEKRLAKVNWCPKDQTVLANEQTMSEEGVKGVCFRCGTPVVQKELSQWFFKITDFADELIDDLDVVDWPESTKVNQRNWIGRSEGLIFTSPVKDTSLTIQTFSTHFEAFYADTFVVIAPDHPRLPELLDGVQNKEEILKQAQAMIDVRGGQNRGEVKEIEGIFTGRYTVDPVGNGDLPIWIANYALADYGTGIVKCSAHDERDFRFAQKYNIRLKPVLFPADAAERARVEALEICYTDMNNGILSEPTPFAGMQAGKHRAEIADFAVKNGFATKKTTYRLRDWLVSRQRYWGAPIPIVYDPEGKPHPIPEEHLPWLLPADVDYLPKGTAPLGTSKELMDRTEKIFGTGWKPEIDTMDTFVCSSWYFFRFADPKNTSAFAGGDAVTRWLPVDLYMGGAEHTVLHLMYARFFTKALQKFGVIQFSEPFLKLRHQGTILAEDGSKMSKSKGNVINPDEVVELYGADTIRLYEMFLGPLETMKPWSTRNIIGPRRFIERVWRLKSKMAEQGNSIGSVLHQTVKKVTDDTASFGLNTAISQLMICLNAFEDQASVLQSEYEVFLTLLAPFAPHITEELWHQLGHSTSIHLEPWPTFDESKLVSDMVTIAVQIAGKTRGTVTVARGVGEEEVLTEARNTAKLKPYLPEMPSKVIFVKDRILNLIP